MSKRRVERAVESLSDEWLGALSATDRLQLWLTARAEGRDEWVEALCQTCPVEHYAGTDMAFRQRVQLAVVLGYGLVYETHLAATQYQWLLESQQLRMLLAWRDSGHEEAVETARERADMLSGAHLWLYVEFHAHERFAEDILGVEIETWYGVHPYGERALTEVQSCLDDEIGRHFAEELVASDGDGMTLEEAVEERYQALRREWERATEAIPF